MASRRQRGCILGDYRCSESTDAPGHTRVANEPLARVLARLWFQVVRDERGESGHVFVAPVRLGHECDD